MQTETNSEARSTWPGWAESLHRRGLGDLVAWALEAAGPLTVLGAQAIYFGRPFLRPALPNGQLNSLAELLENREEASAFAAFLREEGPRDVA
jgi:hypothetical protein